jgi:hypothetical protein
MKLRLLPFLVAALCVSLIAGSALAATSTNALTGGDPGDGGDFEGNFAYAIQLGPDTAGGGTGGQTVFDATFTPWDGTPGATVIAQNQDGPQDNDFGASANDDALESVLSSGRWADADPADITADLEVVSGQAYQLQLLFVEGWNATAPGIRQFNVTVEGDLLYADYDITAVAGDQAVMDGNGTNTAGAVITHTFTAGDDLLNIVLSHGAIDNPRIEALTLEIIPEPGTIALVVAGSLALVGYSVRRRRA